MADDSKSVVDDCCKFIDFNCGSCGLVWPSTYTEVFKVLDGDKVVCDKCKACVRSTVKENRKIKYVLFRHALFWTVLTVFGLTWLLVVGAIFEWVSNLIGWVVLFVSLFLVWCVRVSYEGGKIFDIRLDKF